MCPLTTNVLVASVALSAGAAGAVALDSGTGPAPAARTIRLPPGPEQVRTVVVTRTIHRVHRVHAASAPAPGPARAPARVTVAAPARAVGVAPLHARTSGAAARGGDDRGQGHDD